MLKPGFWLIIGALVLAIAGTVYGDRPRRGGEVTLQGHALRDADGEFTGLGVTYFQALRRAKFDRARFRSDLKFLSDNGFDYIRTLSMVGWEGKEIAPITFKNRADHMVEAWPDYWQQLGEMIDIAYDEFGIRTQLTIFADGQLMPCKADRIAHLDAVLKTVSARKQKVILLEVANEAWQNGFAGTEGINELREYGKYLSDHTTVLVALSATEHATNQSLAQMYVGSAADIATEHFSRDTRTAEGDWLPVHEVYRVNQIKGLMPVSQNEPIGPGASVQSQSEPIKLVTAAAYAWMSGLPMYVHHTRAGVSGDQGFEEMPAMESFRTVRSILPGDIANWRRSEGGDGFVPFITFASGQPDKSCLDVHGAADGVIRHLTCVKGDSFFTLPVGIQRNGVTLESKEALSMEVFDPVSGEIVLTKDVAPGERITLPEGTGAYLIRGRLRT